MTPDELARVLEHLREPGPWPPPVQGARLARPGEMPAGAHAVRKTLVEPWTVRVTYALGAWPYTWDRRPGGYVLADSIALRIGHPDGRRAVGVWIRASVSQRKVAGAPSWVLSWSYVGGMRWRLPLAAYPVAIGIPALKAAVADPTWRTNPYRLEEVA